jgi:hypothetical protein
MPAHGDDEIDPALHERGASLAPAREGRGGVRRGQRNVADRPESASATCAVTKRPSGPVVGQLVDTCTTKSVLVLRFRLRHVQAFPALAAWEKEHRL